MIEIEIEDDAWTAALPEAAAVAERAATAALGAAEGGVVVLLTDDARDRPQRRHRRPLDHGRGPGQGRRPGLVLDLDLDHESGSSRSAVGRCFAASAS